MKPALTMSHNQLNTAVSQNLRQANARALQFDYERNEKGFNAMR